MTDTNGQPTDGKVIYDAAFFEDLTHGSLQSARVVVPLVMDLINPRSVLDVGCGTGSWLRAFVENGVEDILGIDGDYVDRNRLLIDPTHFRSVDLTYPEPLGRTFDLAVCLEVAEHLSARVSTELVRFLTAAAPVVLFSAAIPGQGGTHHVNEQWPEYWSKRFNKHEFTRLDPIRRRIWQDQRVQSWYQQNIYLYVNVNILTQSTQLREEQRSFGSNALELVPHHLLCQWTSFRGLLAALPRAGWLAVQRRLRRGE